MLNANEAKKTAAIILRDAGVGYDKLSAKTVSLQDLARADCVFVKVHGIIVSGQGWEIARAVARDHGFRLQA